MLAFTSALSDLDALGSLAVVAGLQGFTKPKILRDDEERRIVLRGARHPMAEALGGAPYVTNDVTMSLSNGRCIVLTGPNMGGKSALIRTVGVIALLAQIGSYVPAAAAEMSIFRAVLSRIGASDCLVSGLSTFMVEMKEAGPILTHPRIDNALVIIDELGRGTSTHDGVAIAHAALEHLVARCRCFALFVTHFPVICDLSKVHPDVVRCCFMSFQDVGGDIAFLYKLKEGVTPSSFGIRVARMAGIPPGVTAIAEEKADAMKCMEGLSTNRKLLAALVQ
jgi:DNA mismatch repair ATPase MutS